MTDQMQDDEYHFQEDEEAAVFDEDASDLVSTEKSSATDFKTYIIYGFGAILTVLFVYKFVTAFFSSGPSTADADNNSAATEFVSNTGSDEDAQNTENTKPKLTAKPVVTQPQAQPQPQTTYQPPQVQTVTRTVTDPSINRRLTQLTKASSKTQDDVSDLNENIDTMKDSVEGLSQKVSQLNNSLSMLMAELKSQQEQIAKIRQPVKRRRVVRRRTKRYVPKEVYYVQALVPGRAWLRTNKGRRITVIEGSRIKGYGVVQVIDPHQGEVVTSSGKTIRFSVSDL